MQLYLRDEGDTGAGEGLDLGGTKRKKRPENPNDQFIVLDLVSSSFHICILYTPQIVPLNYYGRKYCCTDETLYRQQSVVLDRYIVDCIVDQRSVHQ